MVIGVDEVGRGALIGNVVAVALYLPDEEILGLNDSKKLTAKKREELFAILTQKSQFAIGRVNANKIDEINILNATMLAMQQAVLTINLDYDTALVDGNKCPNIKNCECVIKGDSKFAVIGAASIVAKVVRDREMLELDKKYPEYGFARHKGYSTKEHLTNIKKYGILPEHRKSFAPIKNIL
jgi:ribonuclease HII